MCCAVLRDVTGLAGRGSPGKSEGPPGHEAIPVKYESIVAINEFRDGQLYEARLYPIELGYEEQKLARRGIPVMASPEVSQRILRRLQALSEPLGTDIQIEGSIGIIRP